VVARHLVARHLVARHLESLLTVDRLRHARHQHQEMSVQPAVEDQIGKELHVKFPKVAKSAIHAGFAPPRKNAINHESVQESLNQIFLKM
jgi:hypothetical protein